MFFLKPPLNDQQSPMFPKETLHLVEITEVFQKSKAAESWTDEVTKFKM